MKRREKCEGADEAECGVEEPCSSSSPPVHAKRPRFSSESAEQVGLSRALRR